MAAPKAVGRVKEKVKERAGQIPESDLIPLILDKAAIRARTIVLNASPSAATNVLIERKIANVDMSLWMTMINVSAMHGKRSAIAKAECLIQCHL